MAHYRIYSLNSEGRVGAPPKDIHAENDEAAIQEAKRVLDGHDLEVWCGSRCVGTLSSKDGSRPRWANQ